jgi:hypothetical protein
MTKNKLFMCLVFMITSVASLMAQQVYVQWATNPVSDFVSVTKWKDSPMLPNPTGKNQVELPFKSKAGWVSAIRIEGIIITSCDQYAVVQDEGVTTYCWRDPLQYGLKGAQVCHFGGTPHCAYYGNFNHYQFSNDKEFSFSDFVLPPANLIRYGKMLNPDQWNKTKAFWKGAWALAR